MGCPDSKRNGGDFNIPREASLKKPLPLLANGMVNFNRYQNIAKGQVRYLNQSEHHAIESIVFGEETEGIASAFYAQKIGNAALSAMDRVRHRTSRKLARSVIGLGIWINLDYFGDEHADLITYAEAHEIYEGWLMTAPDAAIDTAHLAARQRQFDLAAADNKADKLLDYYTSKNNTPALIAELLSAHARAMGH